MIQFDEQIFQSGWNHQLVLSLKLFGRILLEKVVENICGMRNGFCWQYYPIWTLVEKVAIITPLKCILLKNDGWTTTFLLLEGNCSGDLLNCRSLFGMFVGMFPCFICFSSAIFRCRTRCFPKVLDCFYKQTSCWNNFQQAIMIEMCRCKSDFAVWIRWFWRVFPLGKPCSCSCGPRHAAVFDVQRTLKPPKLEALVAAENPSIFQIHWLAFNFSLKHRFQSCLDRHLLHVHSIKLR